MEAETVDALPEGRGWQYEPKYDGFRCIAHRGGGATRLLSRTQKPLDRYFPELCTALEAVEEDRFVLDGEIIIPGHEFDTLQLRLHPAESRVRNLSRELPAELVVFDLLARGGETLVDESLSVRRAAARVVLRITGTARACGSARPRRASTSRGAGSISLASTGSSQSA